MKLIAEGSERDRLELQKQLDAQRLRADTAEAYAKGVSKSFDDLSAIVGYSTERLGQTGESPMDCAEQIVRKLAAAEQLIADLSADNQQLRKLLEQTLAALNPTAKLSKSIRAALNPKPERHYSDCATNNRGVPELLGPCDCGYEGGKSK